MLLLKGCENMRLSNKIKNYIAWKKRVVGKEVVDFDRGMGFYINVDLIHQSLFLGANKYNPVGKLSEFEMSDGRIAICKLLNYTTSSNPTDLIEHAYYQIIGYKDAKSFKDMSFLEYLNCKICCELKNK